jgi:hypothetical protein
MGAVRAILISVLLSGLLAGCIDRDHSWDWHGPHWR